MLGLMDVERVSRYPALVFDGCVALRGRAGFCSASMQQLARSFDVAYSKKFFISTLNAKRSVLNLRVFSKDIILPQKNDEHMMVEILLHIEIKHNLNSCMWYALIQLKYNFPLI